MGRSLVLRSSYPSKFPSIFSSSSAVSCSQRQLHHIRRGHSSPCDVLFDPSNFCSELSYLFPCLVTGPLAILYHLGGPLAVAFVVESFCFKGVVLALELSLATLFPCLIPTIVVKPIPGLQYTNPHQSCAPSGKSCCAPCHPRLDERQRWHLYVVSVVCNVTMAWGHCLVDLPSTADARSSCSSSPVAL